MKVFCLLMFLTLVPAPKQSTIDVYGTFQFQQADFEPFQVTFKKDGTYTTDPIKPLWHGDFTIDEYGFLWFYHDNRIWVMGFDLKANKAWYYQLVESEYVDLNEFTIKRIKK